MMKLSILTNDFIMALFLLPVLVEIEIEIETSPEDTVLLVHSISWRMLNAKAVLSHALYHALQIHTSPLYSSGTTKLMGWLIHTQ